jgi:prophage regulatory protein
MTNVDPISTTNNSREQIVRMRELAGRLTISSSHLYALIKAGKFPKPVELVPGGRSKGWPEHELSAWLRSRIALRDATSARPGRPTDDKSMDTATRTQSVTGDRS